MRQTVVRDFSECDVLWFSANQAYDPGSFIEGAQQVSSSGTWLSSGRWLYSGRRQNDVVACSWTKQVEGETTGVCTVQLKSNKGWEELIQPGDALMVFMTSFANTKSRKTVLLSLVFVDTVGEGRAVSNEGATIRTVSVSARDVTKIFAESSTVFDPALVAVDQTFYTPAFLERLGTKFGLSPVEMILNVIDIFYNAPTTELTEDISRYVRTQWRFPGTEQIPIASLIDFGSFVQVPLYGYAVAEVLDIAMSGNLLNLMHSLSNDCVNELFFDIRDLDSQAAESVLYQETLAQAFVDPVDVEEQVALREKVRNSILASGRGFSTSGTNEDVSNEAGVVHTEDGKNSRTTTLAMVLRQRPYDTGSFMRLPFSVVDEVEVIQSSLSRSYHNVSNLFRVSSVPTIPRLLQEATFGIVVNPKSLSRFGLRRRDIETRYPFPSRGSSIDWDIGRAVKPDFDSFFRYYIDLVSTWDAFNERFWEGSLIMHLRPDIRVGTRLVYNRTWLGRQQTLMFYVQAVRHSFVESQGGSQTVLTLVRGIDQNLAWAPEANLFWTTEGRSLPVLDPYEVFQQTGFASLENAAKDGK